MLGAVEDALRRYLDIMDAQAAYHRDLADRTSWAAAKYRSHRLHDVWSRVRSAREGHEGYSSETKAELRSYIEREKHHMPRSKANAVVWAEQKAEAKREREAYRAARRKGQRR